MELQGQCRRGRKRQLNRRDPRSRCRISTKVSGFWYRKTIPLSLPFSLLDTQLYFEAYQRNILLELLTTYGRLVDSVLTGKLLDKSKSSQDTVIVLLQGREK